MTAELTSIERMTLELGLILSTHISLLQMTSLSLLLTIDLQR